MRHHGIYDGNKENKQLHSSARCCAGEQEVETLSMPASPVHLTAVYVHVFQAQVVCGPLKTKRLINIPPILNNKTTSQKQKKRNTSNKHGFLYKQSCFAVTNCIKGIIKYLLIKWMTWIFLAP